MRPSVLPPESSDLERDASLWESIRHSPVFQSIDDATAETLRSAFRRVRVPADEVVFRKGDPGDALYVVVAGRLEVLSDDGRPAARVAPGEIVGEMAIVAGLPRTATVVARRDSILARLSAERFEQALAGRPDMMRALARTVIDRLAPDVRTAPSERRAVDSAVPTAIAIVARTRGAPLREIAAEIATCLTELGITHRIVGRSDALAAAGRSEALGSAGRMDARADSQRALHDAHDALVRMLDDAEARGDHLLLVGDDDVGDDDAEWTRFCAREADCTLAIALAAEVVASTAPPIEHAPRGPVHCFDRRELVLVHDRDRAGLPRETSRWLRDGAYDEVHHLRRGRRVDFARLTRRLVGRANVLVLGGGGARGFAHIGVLEALEEARVPIDFACGTSMGGLIAFLRAREIGAATIREEMKAAFVDRSIYDVRAPLLSAVGGERLSRFTDRAFGGVNIEDLWLPSFAVACDVTRAEAHVLARGSITTAVRATTAIPGIFPPVVDGDAFLLDGGLLDNLPITEARKRAKGRVIAVDVVGGVDPNLRDIFSGGIVKQVGRMLRAPIGHRVPPSVEIALHGFFLPTRRRATRARAGADVWIQPPLEDQSFLDPGVFEVAMRRGREAARNALAGS